VALWIASLNENVAGGRKVFVSLKGEHVDTGFSSGSGLGGRINVNHQNLPLAFQGTQAGNTGPLEIAHCFSSHLRLRIKP